MPKDDGRVYNRVNGSRKVALTLRVRKLVTPSVTPTRNAIRGKWKNPAGTMVRVSANPKGNYMFPHGEAPPK